jgi:outer membrane murein-binding lipoprotein Lpp
VSWATILADLIHAVRRIEEKVDKIMSAQGDINAAVTALNAFFTDLSDVIGELQNGDGTVNTAQLNQVIGQVPALQAAVNALVTTSGTTTSTGTGTSTSASTRTRA